jgi:hypothetical protein
MSQHSGHTSRHLERYAYEARRLAGMLDGLETRDA